MQLFTLYHFLSIRIRMSWNIGDDRNLLLKLQSKLGLYQVVVSKSRKSTEKIALTPVEMQQLPDIEKIDSKDGTFCVKVTKHNGGREVCASYKTDTDMLKNVVSHYRNNLNLRESKLEVKRTEFEKLLSKRINS